MRFTNVPIALVALVALSGCQGPSSSLDSSGSPSPSVVPGAMPLQGKVTTLTGSGAGFWNGSAASAQFNLPQGLALISDKLYVCDGRNHRVRVVDTATGSTTSLVGTGATGIANGSFEGVQFSALAAIAAHGTDLIVADRDATFDGFRTIDIGTSTVSNWVGAASGFAEDPDPVQFNAPMAMVVVNSRMYVGDSGNHRIRVVSFDGSPTKTLAGSGTAGKLDGTGPGAQFNYPSGIAANANGTVLYVSDGGSGLIRQVEVSTGKVTTLAGSQPGTFRTPYGLVALGGYLFVADMKDHSIRAIDLSNGTVSTLAGHRGVGGFGDGTGTGAFFQSPMYLATDGTYLYVSDAENHRIRKIE